ncbi:HAD-IA family hydrolase [Acinetobacter apis]|uniref:Phosphoglycolate phosphatase n=1 Tax=Acinetobacter apis TaxID=1229165 RepID=A0A217EIB9_9GAMM|nr:phosphoglycolate phosphatase [Acinetobacter apis]
MKNKKYLLLDLDGTLTDPKEGIHGCIRYALNKLDLPLDPNVNIDWTIGPPLKNSFKILLNTTDDTLAERALVYYRERFSTVGLFENQIYPTVQATLQTLVERGYNLYLATAKPQIYAQQILTHFNIAQYFRFAYGSELNGDRTNKAELIAYILEKEGISAQDAVMVGDRKYDIIGAHANHMPAIAVTYGYGSAAERAEYVPDDTIDCFSALLTHFNAL